MTAPYGAMAKAKSKFKSAEEFLKALETDESIPSAPKPSPVLAALTAAPLDRAKEPVKPAAPMIAPPPMEMPAPPVSRPVLPPAPRMPEPVAPPVAPPMAPPVVPPVVPPPAPRIPEPTPAPAPIPAPIPPPRMPEPVPTPAPLPLPPPPPPTPAPAPEPEPAVDRDEIARRAVEEAERVAAEERRRLAVEAEAKRKADEEAAISAAAEARKKTAAMPPDLIPVPEPEPILIDKYIPSPRQPVDEPRTPREPVDEPRSPAAPDRSPVPTPAPTPRVPAPEPEPEPIVKPTKKTGDEPAPEAPREPAAPDRTGGEPRGPVTTPSPPVAPPAPRTATPREETPAAPKRKSRWNLRNILRAKGKKGQVGKAFEGGEDIAELTAYLEQQQALAQGRTSRLQNLLGARPPQAGGVPTSSFLR
jgi:hypothetical protein